MYWLRANQPVTEMSNNKPDPTQSLPKPKNEQIDSHERIVTGDVTGDTTGKAVPQSDQNRQTNLFGESADQISRDPIENPPDASGPGTQRDGLQPAGAKTITSKDVETTRAPETQAKKFRFEGLVENEKLPDGTQRVSGDIYKNEPKPATKSRQSRCRDNKKAQGLKRVELWIRPEVEQEIRAYAEERMNRYLQQLPELPD